MKDFNSWNKNKICINENKRPFFKEREVWFIFMGLNIGYEQDGVGKEYLRPIVIFKKFNKEIFWGIPLSRSTKNNPYYVDLFFENEKISRAILSQIKLFDARRLSYKINTINKTKFLELKEKFKDLIP